MMTRFAAAAAGCLLVVAGCATRRDTISVGSKNFTEQVVLGEIVSQHIENRLSVKVERNLNLGGTNVLHQALIGNQLDVYPEYSGTAKASILKLDTVNDPEVIVDRVRDLYRTRWNLEWLPPLGFNNSFAMVVRAGDAGSMKVLSEAERKEWRLGVGYEFESRPDGLSALNTRYDITWKGTPATMDLGLLYKALEQKQVDMVAGNATDGMLTSDRFATLSDDRQAFPPYQASLVARREALDKYPALRAALTELSGKISNDAMRRMNYDVDVRRAGVADVAAGFLRSAGLR